MKKRLTLLCHHVPARDPRIDWVASLASEYFDTTVIGVCNDWEPACAQDAADYPYKVFIIPLAADARFSECKNAGIGFVIKHIIYGVVLCPIFQKWIPSVARAIKNARSGKHAANADNATVDASIRVDQSKPQRHITPTDNSGQPVKSKVGLRKSLSIMYWSFVAFCYRKSRSNYLLASLLSNAGTADVIISADYGTLAAGTAYKKRTGAVLIYDAHEFAPYENPDASPQTTRKMLKSEQKLIRKADYAFTVNPFLAQEMMNTYHVPIGSVPNCTPLHTRMLPYEDDLSPLAGKRTRFLFLGGYASGRGIAELLRAWAEVDPTKAALFLRGPSNAYSEMLVALANDLGILNRSVYFLPPVSEDQLISAAAHADVGIIPYLPYVINHRYCCPNKLSQYMQAGLAILAQDTFYVKDRVLAYQNGLIYDAGVPGSISAAATRLIQEPALLAEMKARSKKSAMEDYNWEKQSMPMRKVFEALQ